MDVGSAMHASVAGSALACARLPVARHRATVSAPKQPPSANGEAGMIPGNASSSSALGVVSDNGVCQ